MKKFLIITVLMVFSLTLMLAQTQAKNIEIEMDNFEEKMEEMADHMEEIAEKLAIEENGTVTINIKNHDSSKVYLGVFTTDLTLADARELNYDLNYGVLISGVVPGSSASRQKLFVNDIIYEIDGRKVIDDSAFLEILKSYNPRDVAKFKIFSAGKHITKDFIFEAKPKTEDGLTVDVSEKDEKVDWNSIAINWIPHFYQFDDIDHINGLMTQMAFEEINDDGLFMNGFGFRIHAGKGFYIGGEWSWYETNKKINYELPNTTTNIEKATRKMDYVNSFGGVTLDKRIYFTKYFQPGIGFLLGGGSQQFKFSQNNADYDWTHFNDGFNATDNNSMSMSRSYVVFQPRADLYIPILSWVGVRGEVGYMMGYSSDPEWKGGDYSITNSPSTECTGLTFSVGPWIEF